jgi:hypothetical protein
MICTGMRMIKNVGSCIEERHRRFGPMMPPGPGWAKPGWTGLDWTGLDWTGLDWTGGLRLLEACCSGATRRVAEQVTPCLGPCDYMATTVVNGCVCVFPNAGGYSDGIAEWRHLIPGDEQRSAEAVSPLQAGTICCQRGSWTDSGCFESGR